MPELRWALVGLGVLFVAGLALWEWRRSRRRHAQPAGEFTATGVIPQGGGESWSRRIEPRIDSLGGARGARDGGDDVAAVEVPVIHPAAEVSLPVAPGAAIDTPRGRAGHDAPGAARDAGYDIGIDADTSVDAHAGAAGATGAAADPAGAADDGADTAAHADAPARPHARAATGAAAPGQGHGEASAPAAPAAPASASSAAIRWPPERADRVLTLRLANAQGALLSGRAVRHALEQAGLVHGPQCIYHRVDAHGNVLASAANMLRPGDLDPAQMGEQQFRGLSLFCVLPGALPPVRMLEELVALARGLAWRMGAVVQDDHGEELDGERLVKLRQSLPDAAEHGTA